MPFYDFKCKTCGKRFEENIPMNSREMPGCPNCKSKETEKLITGCAVGGSSSGGSCKSGSGFT